MAAAFTSNSSNVAADVMPPSFITELRLATYMAVMIKYIVVVFALLPCTAFAADPAMQPGSWDVTSSVAELSVPGLPNFLAKMLRGKSKAEHRRLAAGEGMEALIGPDPKAKCRVDSQAVANGRYEQTLTCPQKKGNSVRVARAGTYDRAGFAGQAIMTGATPKGAMRVVLVQRAARVGN